MRRAVNGCAAKFKFKRLERKGSAKQIRGVTIGRTAKILHKTDRNAMLRRLRSVLNGLLAAPQGFITELRPPAPQKQLPRVANGNVMLKPISAELQMFTLQR